MPAHCRLLQLLCTMYFTFKRKAKTESEGKTNHSHDGSQNMQSREVEHTVHPWQETERNNLVPGVPLSTQIKGV